MAIATRQFLVPILFLIALLAAGCDSPEPEIEPSAQDSASREPQLNPGMHLASLEAWEQGEQSLSQTLEASRELHRQLEAFLLSPDSQALAELRQQWHRTHGRWHQLDPLMALTDSNPGLFGGLEQLAAKIEARPIQPGYLDYLEHYPYTGIVNDITLTINAETLRAQHGLTDASDISLGFHALEFLLWGQTGERPFSDFESAEQASAEQREAGLTLVDLPNNRRRDLLALVSHLLQDDLNNLRARWQGPESQLHQTYHRLHAASRIELLKNAAEHYLREDAPALLASLGSEEAHNAFAGRNLNPLHQGLIGLGQLFQEGENSLLSNLTEAEAGQNWLAQLNQLAAQLEQLEAGQTLESETRQELQRQLEQLAQLLRPTELNHELLSNE